MDLLEKEGVALGLTPTEIEEALRLGRPRSEENWVEARELGGSALKVAVDSFEGGRYLEYECYDNAHAPQGRGVIVLQRWLDQTQGLMEATHDVCSDAYYQWYVDNDVRNHGAVYHLCDGQASLCKVKTSRRDRRELIHIDKWRLLTPWVMVRQKYMEALGIQLGREALRRAQQEKAALPPVPPAGGPGLDQALQAQLEQAHADKRSPRGRVEPEGRVKERGRSRERRKRASLDERLYGNVEKMKEQERSRSRQKKKKKKKELRKDEEEMKERGQYISSGSSTAEESSSESPFQKPSSRGGELWRVAQKKPGKLAERTLAEMTRYLAERTDMGEAGPHWNGQKVMAYLSQVVLVNHPPAKMGVRSHRELVTLAMVVDELLAGNLKYGLDILLQRFKAVETSLQEGGWAMAKHQELIPPAAASLTREDERAAAARLELQAVKLRNFQAKSQKGTPSK